jgi:hypothetical protein
LPFFAQTKTEIPDIAPAQDLQNLSEAQSAQIIEQNTDIQNSV